MSRLRTFPLVNDHIVLMDDGTGKGAAKVKRLLKRMETDTLLPGILAVTLSRKDEAPTGHNLVHLNIWDRENAIRCSSETKEAFEPLVAILQEVGITIVIPKRIALKYPRTALYKSSKIALCPFCGAPATFMGVDYTKPQGGMRHRCLGCASIFQGEV